MPVKRNFIPHLHAFRGIAIFCIVAAHSWGLPLFLSRHIDGPIGLRALDIVLEVLFHDSTLFFALISGLLYSLVLRTKTWRDFYLGKLVNVVSPYIVMTLIFTYIGWDIGGGPTVFGGSATEYVVQTVKNLLLGRGFFHLWYMPVLFWLYILTPLLVRFARYRNADIIFAFVIIAPLFVSRVTREESLFTIVYFFGAYTAGYVAGLNYQTTLTYVRRYSKVLWALAGVSTVGLLAIHAMRIPSIGITSPAESMWYIQKLAAAGLVLLFLHDHEERLPKLLAALGTYAFSVYFLHGFFVHVSSGIFANLGYENPGVLFVGLYGLASLFTMVAISLLISMLLKTVFGNRSRMLIGS